MEKMEIISIIDLISKSLKSKPDQFNFKFEIIGQNIVARNGSTGLVATAHGGGIGSTAIGNNVTLDFANIQIQKDRATEEFRREILEITQKLDEISEELAKSKPDQSKIKALFKSITASGIVPIVIQAVLMKLIEYSNST